MLGVKSTNRERTLYQVQAGVRGKKDESGRIVYEYKITLPTKSVIREVTFDYVSRGGSGSIKFVVGSDEFEYSNLSTVVSNPIHLAVPDGGIVNCYASGVHAARITVFYER